MKVLIFSILFFNIANASSFLEENTKELSWNGVKAVWLKNDKFPLYEINLYFADGALGDKSDKMGETRMMLDQLSSGTLQYNQKQIADIFDFYGTQMSTFVTHEYSYLNIKGIEKDLIPTMKMVCSLFTGATYPSKVLKTYKKRLKTGLKNLVNNHKGLADRIFREASLAGSQYSSPVEGKQSTISKINSKDLKKRLDFFNKNVFKSIYISGSNKVLELEKVLNKDCNWSGKANFVRKVAKVKLPPKKAKPLILFVPIKQANQVQIRIGRLMKPNNNKDEREKLSFATSLLGGGFTSKLMQELRVKRGLTYSVSAMAVYQRDYGRAIISTFTKNETTKESLNVIKQVVDDVSKGNISDEELAHKKNFASGQHLFSFESSSSILGQLSQLDHINVPYNTIYNFPEIVKSITKKEVTSIIKETFDWSKQTIVILGSPKIEKQLKEIGRVKKLNLNNYL